MLFPTALRIALLSTIALAATITTRLQDHVHTRIQIPKAPPPGPTPGLVVKYVNPQDCYSTSPTKQLPRPTSHAVDTCYNLNYPGDMDPKNPEITKRIKVSSPAICEDGRKAQFATFAAPFCFLPLKTVPIDSILGECLDVQGQQGQQIFSFGFACDGIPEILGKDAVQTIILVFVAFAVVFAAAMLVLCCGGMAIFGAALGLVGWGLWRLGRFIKVG
jgi:hypothetical protein